MAICIPGGTTAGPGCPKQARTTTANIIATAGAAEGENRRNFAWPKGPGILMLDPDGVSDGALNADQFREPLISDVPGFSSTPMYWRPSSPASSFAADEDERHPRHSTLDEFVEFRPPVCVMQPIADRISG